MPIRGDTVLSCESMSERLWRSCCVTTTLLPLLRFAFGFGVLVVVSSSASSPPVGRFVGAPAIISMNPATQLSWNQSQAVHLTLIVQQETPHTSIL